MGTQTGPACYGGTFFGAVFFKMKKWNALMCHQFYAYFV